ncbi:hypothetical protein OIU79_012536 [Salix purpurea]|uniref:Uncharacterized protein n=1 Tax=Salix purpurea TaxID=77065 RepID=A0A9Q0Q3I4_SALPP|nr:hypothetical protein OIU79_012536 [Salix purpurea]KAJ6699297.1 hypothetical protein OIU79_012536 [Salix purpurea]
MVDASIDEKCGCETGFNSCCSSHIDRPSSEVWSEKSLDLDFDTSSSTSQSEDQNIDHFVNEDIIDHGDFSSNDKQYFCDSPFHFALQRSPSTGCRTPDFSSPVTSPSRHIFEGKENNGDEESLEKLKEQNDEERKKKIRNSVVLFLFWTHPLKTMTMGMTITTRTMVLIWNAATHLYRVCCFSIIYNLRNYLSILFNLPYHCLVSCLVFYHHNFL